MSHTIVAIAAVIKSCGDAKRRVRRNKKRCTHLVDNIEALQPVLETVKTNEVQHAETLKKLMRVVEDAEALLKRQSAKSSFILRMCISSSVADELDDIDRRLASCTRFLTLSQSALNNAMLSAMSPRAENAPHEVMQSFRAAPGGGQFGTRRLCAARSPGMMSSAVFDALKRWRDRRAKEMGKPPFVVFDDKTLLGIAEKRPASIAELDRVKGVGSKKLQDYGNEVLDIVRSLGDGATGGARGGPTSTSTPSGGLADALQRLYAQGVVQPHQLDSKMHEHLASMPEHAAVAAIDELAGADVSGIRNMNGYLRSICQRHEGPARGNPASPLAATTSSTPGSETGTPVHEFSA